MKERKIDDQILKTNTLDTYLLQKIEELWNIIQADTSFLFLC